jgi:hypothetical protein
MPAISSEIETKLAALLGLPLVKTRRASDLQGFHFGAMRVHASRQGEPVEVGEYALHVQCAFRLRAGHQILAASRDRYEVIDGGDSWDGQGANRLDARMQELVARRCPVRVTAVRGSDAGDLVIEFEAGLVLEVWVDDSGSEEHWRFFKPGDDASHFVF